MVVSRNQFLCAVFRNLNSSYEKRLWTMCDSPGSKNSILTGPANDLQIVV
jgi:hypothetical protein